jgi:hypothetical protein
LAWWYLIACLIYKEQPAGDRQFWVTRPYSWKSLLAAKTLLIVTFINASFLISDIAILSANGLSPSKAAANLLGRQLAITAIFLLPAAALAATTRHLAYIAFALSVVLLLNLFFNPGGSEGLYHLWGRLAWIPEWTTAAILAAGSFAVLAWQYASRRTPISWTILAGVSAICAAILMAKPVGPAIALQSHFPSASADVPEVRLSFAPGAHPKGGIMIGPSKFVQFPPGMHGWVPIRINGFSPGVQVKADLVKVTIHGPQGTSWSSGWIHSSPSTQSRGPIEWAQAWIGDENRFLYVTIGKQPLESFQSQPVSVSVSVAMTVFRTETATQLMSGEPDRSIAGVGNCSVRGMNAPGSPWLLCRSAESSPVRVDVQGIPLIEASYAPKWGIFAQSPVSRLYESLADRRSLFNEGPIYITTGRPVAHVRRDLEIPQIRLWEAPSR